MLCSTRWEIPSDSKGFFDTVARGHYVCSVRGLIEPRLLLFFYILSMAEEERGFLAILQRQLFRTHRPFRSTIFDLDGNIILKVYRPFAWINSRTFVQRHVLDDAEKETVVGEVQQVWHLWRRRYNLFSG
jgi:hypothetical protein